MTFYENCVEAMNKMGPARREAYLRWLAERGSLSDEQYFSLVELHEKLRWEERLK